MPTTCPRDPAVSCPGTACLGHASPVVCEHSRIFQSPGRPPRAARSSAAAIRPGTLVILGHMNSFTGYGQMMVTLAKGLARAGVPIAFNSASTAEHLLPLDPWAKARIVEVDHAGPRLVVLTPSHPVREGDVVFTMWESSRLKREWVENLNRAACVIVPSEWNMEVFRASGVDAPMRLVPLGYDPGVYFPGLTTRPARGATFGASARTSHGGVRKGMADVLAAFSLAFPTGADARLEVKVWPDDEVEPSADPRVRIIRECWSDAELAGWYRSLTAFVSMSRGEGFGLQPLQAMACGTPCILPIQGGHAEYATPASCLPVDYVEDMVPADNPIYGGLGTWCLPSVASAADRMRMAHLDRGLAARMGWAAAGRAAEFTWARSGRELLDVLRDYGLVAHGVAPGACCGGA